MTTETKITRADIERFGVSPALEAFLRERGLIAEEPVDPLLVEAREICAEWYEGRDATDCARRYRTGEWDDTPHAAIALAALRRGMELGRSDRSEALAPRKLTREMVERAVDRATDDCNDSRWDDNFAQRLHAALTEALQ